MAVSIDSTTVEVHLLQITVECSTIYTTNSNTAVHDYNCSTATGREIPRLEHACDSGSSQIAVHGRAPVAFRCTGRYNVLYYRYNVLYRRLSYGDTLGQNRNWKSYIDHLCIAVVFE